VNWGRSPTKKEEKQYLCAELSVTDNKKQKYVVSLHSLSAIQLPDNNKVRDAAIQRARWYRGI